MRLIVIVLLACVFCILASTALAQHLIGIFPDPNALECTLTDNMVGLVTWYIVLSTTGAEAAAFSAPIPGCMIGAVFISQSPPCIDCVAGSIPEGAWVYWGYCAEGIIAVASISIFAQGLSTTCCPYPVLSHPDMNDVVVTRCDQTQAVAAVHTTHINPDPSCTCIVGTAESSTWGRVKALYGE